MENKFTTLIKSRVSCRYYTTTKVPLSKVALVAEAGKMAPSAKNRQIANILVIRNKKYVTRLRELSNEMFGRDCYYGASTIILVYGPKEDRFTVQDCSCILENMFIAATSLKLNSCWINQTDDILSAGAGLKLRKALDIPTDSFIVGTCVLGYAADPESLVIKDRKEDFIRYL